VDKRESERGITERKRGQSSDVLRRKKMGGKTWYGGGGRDGRETGCTGVGGGGKCHEGDVCYSHLIGEGKGGVLGFLGVKGETGGTYYERGGSPEGGCPVVMDGFGLRRGEPGPVGAWW